MSFYYGGFSRYGGIGITYHNTLGFIITHAILATIIILSIIGIVTILRWRKKKNSPTDETPGKRWLRTGKID